MRVLPGILFNTLVSAALFYFRYLYNMSGAHKYIHNGYFGQQLLEAQTFCACLQFNFGKKSNYYPTCKDFHN